MKLPFCIVAREDTLDLSKLRYLAKRIAIAHRWLAEFDFMLEPLWKFVNDREPREPIAAVREEMRSTLGGLVEERDAMKYALERIYHDRELNQHAARKIAEETLISCGYCQTEKETLFAIQNDRRATQRREQGLSDA